MSELPGVLAEVEEVAGRDAALKLALGFGGEQVHVPRPENVKAGHKLVDSLGAPAAFLVAGRFQGEQIYVPKARRAIVLDLHARGASARYIATKIGVSTRAVRQYIRRA